MQKGPSYVPTLPLQRREAPDRSQVSQLPVTSPSLNQFSSNSFSHIPGPIPEQQAQEKQGGCRSLLLPQHESWSHT